MIDITIKPFEFALEDNKAFSYARTKVITRILNSFSLLLPVGERYFIESIRAFKPDANEEMQNNIMLFIRQEAQHGKEHRKLNRMLNIDTDICDKEALDLLNKYGIDKDHALLITVTLERLTGLMGIVLPKTKSFLFPEKSQIARMWIKHGEEELEHVPVGEKLLHEQCNFSYLYQAKYMLIAITELSKIVYKNYKRLKHAEEGYGLG
ncbi:hypothetical protein [Synechococcus phage BUCT-ZZ01]|nr:hypothetical protein [Synechococcus phage BUCT-ZZ01]